MEDVGNPSLDVIEGRGGWHGNLGGEPCQGVGDVLGMRVRCPDHVALVRTKGRPKVPTVNPVRGPSLANNGLFMDDDADARRGNGCAVEIEGAMELCPGG